MEDFEIVIKIVQNREKVKYCKKFLYNKESLYIAVLSYVISALKILIFSPRCLSTKRIFRGLLKRSV